MGICCRVRSGVARYSVAVEVTVEHPVVGRTVPGDRDSRRPPLCEAVLVAQREGGRSRLVGIARPQRYRYAPCDLGAVARGRSLCPRPEGQEQQDSRPDQMSDLISFHRDHPSIY